MATFHLSGATTVADLCEQFNTAFGSQLKIYNATIFSNCYHKAQEAIAVRLVQDIK